MTGDIGAFGKGAGVFSVNPDPANPGWFSWNLADESGFNATALGHLIARPEPPNGARLRLIAGPRHANFAGGVHGGAILTLIDVALFTGACIALGKDFGGAVTLDLSCQFIRAGRVGEPLDAVVEVLRETARLVFLRGTVVQGERLIAAFSGTLRKASAPAPAVAR